MNPVHPRFVKGTDLATSAKLHPPDLNVHSEDIHKLVDAADAESAVAGGWHGQVDAERSGREGSVSIPTRTPGMEPSRRKIGGRLTVSAYENVHGSKRAEAGYRLDALALTGRERVENKRNV